MLVTEIVLTALTAFGLGGALLKAVHDHGQTTGELRDAVAENTKATNHLSQSMEKADGILMDHEIRITKLESR